MDEDVLPYLRNEFNMDKLWVMMDGAPAHWYRIVRQFIDNSFPDKWIGREGPVAWPPRSPDLTPPDFFLWGYVKDKVYASNPQNLSDLQLAITQVVNNIPVDMCKTVCRSVERRYQRCLEADGLQIQ